MTYPMVVVPLSEEDGGGFMAYAPDLPGCKSDGETPVEAISNLADAIEGWIETAKELGRLVPAPGATIEAESLKREHFENRLLDVAERALEAAMNEREKRISEVGFLKQAFEDLTKLVSELRLAKARPNRLIAGDAVASIIVGPERSRADRH